MTITLRIDDHDQLPDGGPVEFTAGPRSFDIGRQQHLDWCLPDPERIVSGLHCQVRYDGGAYWLDDVSSNGTFVNGAAGRVKSPYRLANGDRLQIGNYHITVTLDGGEANSAPALAPQLPPARPLPPEPPPFAPDDIWASSVPTSEPVDKRWFVDKQRQDRGNRAPDPMEQYIELPMARPAQQSPFVSDFARPSAFPAGNVPGSEISEYPSAGPPRPGRVPDQRAPAPQQGLSAESFLELVCAAAGISPQAMTRRDAREVAADLGAVLAIVTQQMTGLLQARATARLIAKSGNRTMIGATGNNPLKFTTNAAEALEIMFQRNRAGYLDAPASFREACDDIVAHEKAMFSAMQKALARVTEDLSPESVEDKVSGSAFASRKARAWDLYVQRWNAKTEQYENGILDVFIAYFAESYDEATKK